MKKYLILLGLLIGTVNLYSMNLLEMDGINFKMTLSYQQSLLYEIIKADCDLRAPDMELEMEANSEQFTLNAAVSLPLALTDCYFTYTLTDTMLIMAGQFKNPFGTEMNMSKKARPYAGHSLSSNSIAPGYTRGVALAVKKINEFMGFTAGLFSGESIDKKGSSVLDLLPAGNLMLEFPLGDKLTLQGSYSGLIELDFTGSFQYYLAQGFAVRMDFNLGKKNDVVLFGEFLEKFHNGIWLNSNPYWTYGVFTYAAWTLQQWQPFAAFEYYIDNNAAQSLNDKMVVTGGSNLFPLGNLRLCLQYQWDYTYLSGSSLHEAELILSYKL